MAKNAAAPATITLKHLAAALAEEHDLSKKAAEAILTDMVDKIRQEFDTDKRKDIARQFQQYMAQKMYAVPFPGQAAPFALSWPCLGNANVYNVGGEGYGAGTETVPFLWLDQTKPPISG